MGDARSSSRQPKPIARVLLDPLGLVVACVVIVLALALPRDGLGVDLCPFHALTGLPCPGCGLGRSVASLARLDLVASIRFHPFGPIVLTTCVALAACALAGRRRRDAVAAWLTAREASARAVYFSLVYAFVAFGVVRLALYVLDPRAFAAL